MNVKDGDTAIRSLMGALSLREQLSQALQYLKGVGGLLDRVAVLADGAADSGVLGEIKGLREQLRVELTTLGEGVNETNKEHLHH